MMVFVMSDCIYSNMGGTAVKVDLSSLEHDVLGTFLYAQLAERKLVASQHRSRAGRNVNISSLIVLFI